MKINNLIDKFTINPSLDIEPNFKLVKTIEVNASEHKGCFKCNDTHSQINLKSAPWTSVQHCNSCNTLNVVYYNDRMGGVSTDTIECYKNK